MPNLWDKTPEAPFPSELNPLTNPVLEQNLGRWAKVYFNNPPAKREQAVSNLLEEIKRESGAGPPAAAQPDRPYFATDPKFLRAVCSACQHQNPPGHKFCSRCGQVLGRGTATFDGKSGCAQNYRSVSVRLRQRSGVAERPGIQRPGRSGCAPKARMEISGGRGRHCVGWFCICAMGSRAPDKSGFSRQRAAGHCASDVVPAGNLFAR